MKDFFEITLIWTTYVVWLVILFAITSIGLSVLKSLDLNYENTVCCIYGYICGNIWVRVNRHKN